MHYYSTSDTSLKADFREATIKGQPADKGLYFPSEIPVLQDDFIKNISQFSNEEIALLIIRPYVGKSITPDALTKIVAETINFKFPLVPVTHSISSFELHHGPTLAFKDVGARFMSRCLGYFSGSLNKKTTVLVATSGDTGGAVADAFYNVDDVEVVILYPSGKVSHIQELQLTTPGNNVKALQIEGSFDDCQRMVKSAFADNELQQRRLLTSANSISIARWLPQQFYYFFAWKLWADKNSPPVISVPSGNFGNLCAGLLAYRSGLPVGHFIAACNANDTVAQYFKTGTYAPKKATATISNAMDVGDPSNFIRILELFKYDVQLLKKILTADSITDVETRNVIRSLYNDHNYLADPHGAVAYAALRKYLDHNNGMKGYFLETAHPVKFSDVVEPVIGKKLDLPQSVQFLLDKESIKTKIKADYGELKEFLMENK